jgi:hypothetical protein
MHTPTQPTRGVSVDSLDGAVWHRSSYSGTQGNCVEVAATLPGIVAVRDSHDPRGPRLMFTPDAWRAFLCMMKAAG